MALSYHPTLAVLALLLLAIPLAGHTKIYKCVTPGGALAYQEKPCAAKASESIVDVIEYPDPPAVTAPLPQPLSNIGATPSNQRSDAAQARKAEADKRKRMQCQRARKAYDRQAKSVVAACKQARNTYCNQSPEKIEATTDRQWQRGASNRQLQNYSRNNAGGTVLQRLKRDVATYCR
ncbi:MAG: DUF4124 domain-containing protein [Pseudomonadales bacterium]